MVILIKKVKNAQNEAQADLTSMAKNLQLARDEREKAENTAKASVAQVEKLTNDLRAAQNSLKVHEASAADKAREALTASKAGEKKAAEAAEKDTQISELTAKVKELQGSVRTLKDEKDQLEITIKNKAEEATNSLESALRQQEKAKDLKLRELQEQIDGKNAKIEELVAATKENQTDAVKRLERELTLQKQKVEQRNVAADMFRKQAVQLQLDLDALQDKIASADKYQAEGAAQDEKIALLQKEIQMIQGMSTQNVALTSRVNELTETVDKKNEQIRLLREDIDRRDQELLLVKSQVRELKVETLGKDSTIAELKKALERAGEKSKANLSTEALAENFSYNISVDDPEDKKPKSDQPPHETQKQLFDEITQKLSSTQIDLTNAQAFGQQQLEIVKKLEKEIYDIKAKNMEAKIEAQRNQLDQVRAQFKAAESESSIRADQLTAAKEENTELLKKLEKTNSVEQENTGLQNQITALTAEVQRLAEAHENHEKLLQQTQNDLAKQVVKTQAGIERADNIKKTLLDTHVEALKNHEQETSLSLKEIQTLKGRIKELETMVTENRESANTNKSTARVNTRKANNLERLLEDSKVEITTRDKEIKDLRLRIEEFKKKNHQTLLEMEEFKSKASNLEHRLGMIQKGPTSVAQPAVDSK